MPVNEHRPPPLPEALDVLIVGAGISGIGAATQLRQQCQSKRFLVVEAMESIGGTWNTHRYPGVRSDSDRFTFGYRFKPWLGDSIASGAQILRYLGEVIEEQQLGAHLRLRHRVLRAEWSSAQASWNVEIEHPAHDGDGLRVSRVRCGFLWMCQGYYSHAQGHVPQWPGMGDFAGRVIHPQQWPAEQDFQGQRVVVVGSGATAATLIPALADRCAHVTMLQRSPTWFVTGRRANELADVLRDLDIPAEWTHEIVRRKVLKEQALLQRRCVEQPDAVAAELLAGVKAALGPDHEHLVARHFTPRYRPWQQRIAFVPDGDLFKAIRQGQASVVTGEIDRFVREGVQLQDGTVLPADVVVSATGFHLNVLGDIAFAIDGTPLQFEKAVTWRGAMFTGIPNLLWVFGYFRASWTLRADLLADFVCRLLGHMDRLGYCRVEPQLRDHEVQMALKPWVDPGNFNPGYLERSLDRLPRQGAHEPWLHKQDYWSEKDEFPVAPLDDGTLRFG